MPRRCTNTRMDSPCSEKSEAGEGRGPSTGRMRQVKFFYSRLLCMCVCSDKGRTRACACQCVAHVAHGLANIRIRKGIAGQVAPWCCLCAPAPLLGYFREHWRLLRCWLGAGAAGHRVTCQRSSTCDVPAASCVCFVPSPRRRRRGGTRSFETQLHKFMSAVNEGIELCLRRVGVGRFWLSRLLETLEIRKKMRNYLHLLLSQFCRRTLNRH